MTSQAPPPQTGLKVAQDRPQGQPAPFWCDFCGTSHRQPHIEAECKLAQTDPDYRWETA